MSDELQNGVPPVPEPGTGAGQPEPTAEEQQPTPPAKINLDDLEDFRKWKSESDRRFTAEQRAREQAEAQAEAERAQREALIEQVKTLDPDAAKVLIEVAHVKELETKVAQYQVREWERDVYDWARDKELDVDTEEFRAAVASRDSSRLDRLAEQKDNERKLEQLATEKAKEILKAAGIELPAKPSETPAGTAPASPPPQARPAAALPPSGGGSTSANAEQQQIEDGYKAEIQAERAKGYRVDVASIGRKWRQIARERGVEPPF